MNEKSVRGTTSSAPSSLQENTMYYKFRVAVKHRRGHREKLLLNGQIEEPNPIF